MTTWVEFNINNYVKVRLTDTGRQTVRLNHILRNRIIVSQGGQPLPESPSLEEDADGWSLWQLHALINEFGMDVYFGNPLPFEAAIQFEVKERILLTGETNQP